jgi:hypothetical protein
VSGTAVASKTYDGTAVASLSGGTLQGVVTGDVVTLAQAGSFADKNVGAGKSLTAADTLGGSDASNYTLTQPTGLSADISAKALTVSGTAVASKTYDGAAVAILSGGTLQGVVAGDVVSLAQAGSFSNKNVGTGKSVTAADTLGGSDASNYTLTQPTGLSADISAKALTVSGTAVASKTYDGTAVASLSGGTLQGVVTGDVVTLAQAGSFSNKNVGTGKSVTAADTLGGSDASNYTLTQPTGLNASIAPLALQVVGLAVQDKVYDGTTAATVVDWGSLTGLVVGERLALQHGGASFADAAVGTYKTVTATGYSLADVANSGLAANYQLNASTATTTASISAPPPPPLVSTPSLPIPSATPLLNAPTVPAGVGNAPTVTPTAMGSLPVTSSGNTEAPGTALVNNAPQANTPAQPTATVSASVGNSVASASASPTQGSVTVSMVREPSVQQAGVISVSVSREMATAGAGFGFPLPAQVTQSAPANAAVTVTTTAGTALPGWLRFNPATKTFTATAVPDGAFPMQVVVTVAGQRSTIVISERPN